MTRIWVTREEPPDGPLSTALRRHRLEPVVEPVIQRTITADLAPALANLKPADWLVLTSLFLIERIPKPPTCRIAVVGVSSRDAALARGLHVDLTSPDSTGAGLWRELATRLIPGDRIFYPRSAQAELPPHVPGVELNAPIAYTTTPRPFNPAVAAQAAAAALASPSAVNAIASLPNLPPLASIGPTTTQAIRNHHLPLWLESPAPTFPALAQAIANRLRSPHPGP